MSSFLGDFLSWLERSQDTDALQDVLAKVGRSVGVSAIAYVNHGDAGRLSPKIISNYPDSWTRRYIERQYCRIDPVLDAAERSFVPFYWACPDSDSFRVNCRDTPHEQRCLFEDAIVHGISCGFTVPIHNHLGCVASFNIASDLPLEEFTRIVAANNDALFLISMYFHTCVCERRLAIFGGARNLSPREISCLQWQARGKSQSDIATILGLSRRTVKFHIENAMRKFDVTTARQAIVRAIMEGIIDPL